MTDREECLGEGRFLRLVRRRGWEIAERPGVEAIVAILAVTGDDQVILIEQYREAVRSRVVELPAGLVGDGEGSRGESLATAARRELEEETGWTADHFELLTAGPPSAGLTSEVVSFVRARGVRRWGPGGGVGDEEIVTHLVPRSDLGEWLRRHEAAGGLIDPKVFAALYFLALGQ